MCHLGAMSSDAVTEETPPPRSARSVALLATPFAGLVVAIGLAVLYGLTLPNSSSPSDDAAANAVLVMWLAAVAALVVGAWSAGERQSVGRAVLLVTFVTLAALGLFVARRVDAAWVDACDFGGSGDRCTGGDASAPTWVMMAWPTAGAVVAACCGMIAAAGRRAGRKELQPFCALRASGHVARRRPETSLPRG